MRLLFLIRDKMGDSLIAANVALAFARANPQWIVSVMMRRPYAYPLQFESSITLHSFRNGAQALLLAAWWRITGKKFDVLAVLRGYGTRTRSIAKAIPAKEIVVHEPVLSDVATRFVAMPAGWEPSTIPHYEPSFRVASALSPGLEEPRAIRFPALAARWESASKSCVVIFPVSDEPRRSLPAESVEELYSALSARHPGKKVLVLVRNRKEIGVFSRRPAIPFTTFCNVPNLCRLLLESEHYYGVDTGPMHLAAGMGMPCTVFFGPTQPHRVLPPDQPGVEALRVPVLGTKHCDVVECTDPVCIEQAVVRFVGKGAPEPAPRLPQCPLRTSERDTGRVRK